MVIHLADWSFSVDVAGTAAHTMKCASDHCLCAYCRNYYETIDLAHPSLRAFLETFGVVMEGPSELMPLEPTLMAACYRVTGEIRSVGTVPIHVDGVPIRPEPAENGTFFLWIGEVELPWRQQEPMEDVISPANQPEFLERMTKKVMEWYPESEIQS